MADDFSVLKTIGTTQDREHELGDELLRTITAITARLRQTGSGKDGLKSRVVKHAFHDAHTAPGGDFFVGKTQVKFDPNPRTEYAIA